MEEPRLYIIDDDPLVAELVSVVGQSVGFQACVVPDPRALGNLLKDGPQCAVVLDIVMPDIDGLEILKILGANRFKGPILILSGMDSLYLEAASRSCRRLGLTFSGSLSKPIDLPALGEALEKMKHSL